MECRPRLGPAKETAALQKAKLSEAKRKVMEDEARKAEAAREVEAEKAQAEKEAHEAAVLELKNELKLSQNEVARLNEAVAQGMELQHSIQNSADAGTDAMAEFSHRLAVAEKDNRDQAKEIQQAAQLNTKAKKAIAAANVAVHRPRRRPRDFQGAGVDDERVRVDARLHRHRLPRGAGRRPLRQRRAPHPRDDGGEGAEYGWCHEGSDCVDCGGRAEAEESGTQ